MSASTAHTPLIFPTEKQEIPRILDSTAVDNMASSNEQELQFYDPSAILGISRDVAFGYLILLTGGNMDYKAPTLEEVSSIQKQPKASHTSGKAQPSSPLALTLDEEAASLAYASIVDGNVLHACFGLKAAGNGRASPVPIIGDKHSQSSVFCCFPNSSSAALQLVLPHAAKNKLKLQNLAEVLRELQDLHHERIEAGGARGAEKDPLYECIIGAYSQCFTSIVRYHDAKNLVTKKGSKNNKGDRKKQGGIIGRCSSLFGKLFSKSKNDLRLECLQNGALEDIEGGFVGLKEDIWDCLERTANETAFTGISVDGSAAGESSGEKR